MVGNEPKRRRLAPQTSAVESEASRVRVEGEDEGREGMLDDSQETLVLGAPSPVRPPRVLWLSFSQTKGARVSILNSYRFSFFLHCCAANAAQAAEGGLHAAPAAKAAGAEPGEGGALAETVSPKPAAPAEKASPAPVPKPGKMGPPPPPAHLVEVRDEDGAVEVKD